MSSDSNELLNFQNPELLLFCLSLEKEIKIGEWSLEIAGIISVSNIILEYYWKWKNNLNVFEGTLIHIFAEKYIVLL